MIKKGIVLAGGNATRLFPTNLSTSKHLLPIYNKPTIYYSISILMLMKINFIIIICREKDLKNYKNLLGDGKRFGCTFKFVKQNKASGIPNAVNLSKKLLGKDNFVLILGDNFFFGHNLSTYLKRISTKFKKGSVIFTYKVKKPELYGIVDRNQKNILLLEKPAHSRSNEAITGLYIFDSKFHDYFKMIKPSARGETEITDILNLYLKQKGLMISKFQRGTTWLDTGSYDDLLSASNFVRVIEDRQNLKIACLEELALFNKWISKKELRHNIRNDPVSNYTNYLKKLSFENH